MTAAHDVLTAYAEDLAEAEAQAQSEREVTHAALDLLHVAYLEELDTYETLERYRAENRELRAENQTLKAENLRLRAERGQQP